MPASTTWHQEVRLDVHGPPSALVHQAVMCIFLCETQASWAGPNSIHPQMFSKVWVGVQTSEFLGIGNLTAGVADFTGASGAIYTKCISSQTS